MLLPYFKLLLIIFPHINLHSILLWRAPQQLPLRASRELQHLNTDSPLHYISHQPRTWSQSSFPTCSPLPGLFIEHCHPGPLRSLVLPRWTLLSVSSVSLGLPSVYTLPDLASRWIAAYPCDLCFASRTTVIGLPPALTHARLVFVWPPPALTSALL